MKKKTWQKKFKIISNRRIKGSYFKLILAAPEIAFFARPGQFVMAQVDSNVYEPLLRRPLSIHAVKKDNIEILYETLGQGTEILSRKKPAEYLDLIGPLGNGFDRVPSTEHRAPILVAGGIGVAPLVFLAQKLRPGKTLALIGARTKENLLCEKEFEELDCDVKIATDDGSKGFRGRVTDLLEKQLVSNISHRIPNTLPGRQAGEHRTPIMYACGPAVMLKAIARIAAQYGIEAFGSFEAHMACGIGVCMGCAIKIKDQAPGKDKLVYKRVCKDGPVFGLSQIIWGKD